MPKRPKALTQITNGRELPSKRSCLQKQPRQQRQQCVGTILKMILKNFMCHEHLEVCFEDNLNFITGRNGSGKSAIITGLVLGLGAKATVTSRGKSIKSFIKAGQSTATIIIVINNAGPKGYNSKVYGDSITVERQIKANGASNYKTKSETGHLVSTRVGEIAKITMALKLQINNPVCVLNQDTSRNFLSSGNPKIRFNLFYQASQLQDIHDQYKEGVKHFRSLKAVEDEALKSQEKLASEVKRMSKRIKVHQSIATLNDNVAKMEVELLWSKVANSEKEHNNQAKCVDKVKTKFDNLQSKVQSQSDENKEIQEVISNCQRKINEYQQQQGVLDTPMRNCKASVEKAREDLKELGREKDIAKRSISQKENDCNIIKKEIENFTEKSTEIERARIENQKELHQLQEDLKRSAQTKMTLQNDKFQVTSDLQGREEKFQTMELEMRERRSKLSKAVDNLNAVKRNNDNQLAIYGRHIMQLVECINQQKSRFSQPPRGPVGSYISVKDKKWLLAIESYIGKALLSAFLVNNSADAQLLTQIMKNNNIYNVTIITSKFFHNVHNVSDNLVRKTRGCVSIFETILVSDNVVMNVVIDQLSIENVLLIPDMETAIELLSNRNNVPKNCNLGFTPNGDKFYPDPSYRVYSSHYHNSKYLEVEKADVIRQHEDAINEHKVTIQNLSEQYKELQQELSQRRKILSEIDNRLEVCKRNQAVARNRIAELQSTDENDIGSVGQLEVELEEINRNIQKFKEKLEAIETRSLEKAKEIQNVTEDYNKLFKQYDTFTEQIRSMQAEIDEQNLKQTEYATAKKYQKQRLEECKRELTVAENELKARSVVLDDMIAKASKFGERVEDARPVHELTRDIEKYQTEIRNLNTEIDKVDDLIKEYQEKNERFESNTKNLDNLTTSIQDMAIIIKDLKRKLEEIKDFAQNSLTFCFQKFLQNRNFKGNINLSYKDETLDLVVMPKKCNTIMQTANLSGGERSFSTVAFLYALWQSLDVPFYFLDEFDVFMDSSNRSTVMNILIDFAKTQKQKQFVFLTPQDVSFIENQDVPVHRLDDPVRGALTQ